MWLWRFVDQWVDRNRIQIFRAEGSPRLDKDGSASYRVVDESWASRSQESPVIWMDSKIEIDRLWIDRSPVAMIDLPRESGIHKVARKSLAPWDGLSTRYEGPWPRKRIVAHINHPGWRPRSDAARCNAFWSRTERDTGSATSPLGRRWQTLSPKSFANHGRSLIRNVRCQIRETRFPYGM